MQMMARSARITAPAVRIAVRVTSVSLPLGLLCLTENSNRTLDIFEATWNDFLFAFGASRGLVRRLPGDCKIGAIVAGGAVFRDSETVSRFPVSLSRKAARCGPAFETVRQECLEEI